MATALISPVEAERSSVGPDCVHLGFRLGRSVLELEVTDRAARGLIEGAYAPMLCEPVGSRTRASLKRLPDGRLHVRYGRAPLAPANASDPVLLRGAYHAAREIFARFATEAPDTMAFYGALCALFGGAVLLLGPTASGKTLLALHLAHAGARFLGDETALLAPSSGEMRAMPRRPALREHDVEFLPSEPMRSAVAASESFFQTERGRFWYALDEQALCGIEPSAAAFPLRAVCVIRERGTSSAVRRLEKNDGLKQLAQRAYQRPSSLSEAGALQRATRRASFFELTLGDPQSAADLLISEVRACE